MLKNLFGGASDKAAPAESAAPLRQLPAGQIENDGRVTTADAGLVALAADGWIIKQKIDALQKELKTITDALQNSLGAGASLALDGLCKVTISGRQSFKLADPDKCAAILGGRFADLVDTTIEYTLSDKLKEIVLDPDHPLSDGLRGCVQIKDSVSVTFRAGKAL